MYKGKRPHVWIVNHYAKRPEQAGGSRHFQLGRYLVELGWDVSIVAASVEHPSGRQMLGKNEAHKIEAINGVTFLNVRTPAYSGNGLSRIANMIIFFYKVLSRSTRDNLAQPDLVIGSSVHLLAAFAGWLTSIRYKVPFVFEERDLWPQTLIDMGRISEKSVAAKVIRAVEVFLYKRAARIITLFPKAVDYIVGFDIPKDKVLWLPNGVDMTQFSNVEEYNPSESKNFDLMYFGSHGEANALAVIIEAMSEVKKMDIRIGIRFRLVGDGAQKKNLMELAKNLGISEMISFEDPVPKLAIPKLAEQADAFIIAVRDLPNLYRYGISMNKIYDYMAAGRPTLIASAAINNPIMEAGGGITVAPDNPLDMARAIVELAQSSSEEKRKMARSARTHVSEFYDYKVLAKKLCNEMDEVLGIQPQKNT